MTLNLTIPQQSHTDFTPRITVIGVGGGGTNAVDNMIALNLQGVDFVVANTDAQQLMHSRADRRIQLGPHITQGLGAGANPDIGRAAAEEAADELYRHLDGTHMLFVAAGMGGGTGTGAAPVIARMARERGILTVGVVTKPFTFEGSRRSRHADKGIEELQHYVDTLIVIPNQNLFRMSNERTTWKEAFKMADHVLYMGVRGVTDLMMTPGLVNLDFADVRTVMQEMGKAMMGTGEAEGENRAIRAAEAAISNPLLEDTSMSGARGLLINITGGDDLTLFEVDQAATRIGEEVAPDANIIFGSALDSSLQGKIRVSVVATGIDTPIDRSESRPYLVAVGSDLVPDDAVGASLPGTAQTQTTIPPVTLREAPSFVPPTSDPSTGAPQAEPSRAPEQQGQQHDQHFGPQHGQQHAQPERRAPKQQPPVIDLTPIEQTRQPPRAAHGASLFAEAPRTATPSAPAMEPVGGKPVSMFAKVTGLFRRGGGEPAAAPIQRAEPAMSEPRAEPRHEPRPMVRPAVNEEQVSDVPAFLRRQTS
jgi:cell division protein FtsZ